YGTHGPRFSINRDRMMNGHGGKRPGAGRPSRSNPTRRRKRSYDASPRLAWPQSVCKRFVDGARSNPTRRRKRSYDASPRLAWPQSVCKRFVDGASPELATAFALLLYTGQRRGDVCRMRWSDFDGKFISVVQEKTGEHVHVRVHRDLRAALMKIEHRGEF